MAKVKTKGTVLKETISAVLTAVAQVISLDHSGAETETVEADTLDNASAGIPYEATGRAEGGSIDGELFFDPALAGHQLFTDHIIAPADIIYTLTFADSGSTVWTFTAAGYGFDVSVSPGDLLKASFSLKVDGLVTYAT
jgi:hypothetical protein